MRLGLDVDGVMYNFTEAWLYAPTTLAYMRRNGIEFPEDPDFHKWDDWKRMGFTLEGFLETCEAGVDDEYIFRVGKPDEGVRDVVEALKDDGHTIHVITHRMFGKKSVQNTVEWFQEYEIPFDTITFAEDKTIVGVDLLLDDRDINYEQSLQQDIPCVLMDRDWNQHVKFAPRVSDWYEFHEYVQQMEIDLLRSEVEKHPGVLWVDLVERKSYDGK